MAVDEEGTAHSRDFLATGRWSEVSVRELAPGGTPGLSSTAGETSRGQWNLGRMASRPMVHPLVDQILRRAPPQDRAPRLVAEGARREEWTGSVVELAPRFGQTVAEDARRAGRRERSSEDC